MDSYTSPTTKPLYRTINVIYYLLGLLEVLLVFRFFLRLFGANPGAEFTAFVYNLSYIFVAPFLNVFRVSPVIGNVGTFEWTTLLAMFVYWLVALGIIQLLLMSRTVSTPEAAAKLEQQDQ